MTSELTTAINRAAQAVEIAGVAVLLLGALAAAARSATGYRRKLSADHA